MNAPLKEAPYSSAFYRKTGFQDFSAIYSRFYLEISSFVARRFKLRPSEAEDIATDAFLHAFEAIGRFKKGHLKSWIYRIARNEALNYLGGRQRRQRLEEGRNDLAENTLGDFSRAESRSTDPLAAALDSQLESDWEKIMSLVELPKYRETLELRVDGLSYGEIKERLGIPVGTVMSRLHRARKYFKEFSKQHGLSGASPSTTLDYLVEHF